MIVLGSSGAVSHDPSAALFVDGELVAAAEEERFLREKHAKGKYPYEAARFCLEHAGVRPGQVQVVAFPYARIGLGSPARWHYARRHWYAPDRALSALLNGNRRFREDFGDRIGEFCYAVYKQRETVCPDCPVEMTFADGTTDEGLVYIATEDNAAFAGPAPVAEIARRIAASQGPSGPNRDYLLNLAAALRELGATDAHVFALEAELRALEDGWRVVPFLTGTDIRGALADELAAVENAEIAVIQEFLPAQLSEDELAEMVDAAIAESS